MIGLPFETDDDVKAIPFWQTYSPPDSFNRGRARIGMAGGLERESLHPETRDPFSMGASP